MSEVTTINQDYLISSATLTQLANEARSLTGATSDLTPAQMTTQFQLANTETESQFQLISQIMNVVNTLQNIPEFITVYVGSTEPTTDTGSDGDIYLVVT